MGGLYKTYTEATLVDAHPIVASYGAKHSGTRGAGDRLGRILTAVGVDHDVKTYAGRRALVSEPPRPGDLRLFAVLFRLTGDPYHEPSARDARRRILDFFGAHLRARAGSGWPLLRLGHPTARQRRQRLDQGIAGTGLGAGRLGHRLRDPGERRAATAR